ncbi:DUF4145 domain-containing protein [Pseudomonas simiae]|uniref:DUF4145 domain-containing protein n=1 Tax=Pseudomonas simiae TaxID=321846 RepID=UPI0018E61672|nr:DUF4145 domain-containing protein [Pseudomonas simiae]MBI6611605.1 DUF4145 domain-containing protein [Pseudomonas simiae]
MGAKYESPKFQGKAFTCLHPECMTLTSMAWTPLTGRKWGDTFSTEYWYCKCDHCEQNSVWLRYGEGDDEGRLIYPDQLAVPHGHEAMPKECLADFDEAREICERSPRGAAALLRLCLQKLLVHLGGKGEKIDTDIKALVANGLDEHVQQALDVIRVTGNNAVHPLEMNLEDDHESVLVLFEMINFIVEERISRPLKTKDRFANLPEKARLAIEKRDKPRA